MPLPDTTKQSTSTGGDREDNVIAVRSKPMVSVPFIQFDRSIT